MFINKTTKGLIMMKNKKLNDVFVKFKDDVDEIDDFVRRISKLKVGESTRLKIKRNVLDDNNYGKVTCLTVGESPRKFMVSGSNIIPNGKGYTLKKIVENLVKSMGPTIDNVVADL